MSLAGREPFAHRGRSPSPLPSSLFVPSHVPFTLTLPFSQNIPPKKAPPPCPPVSECSNSNPVVVNGTDESRDPNKEKGKENCPLPPPAEGAKV